jgi:hypothetical protein
MSEMNVSVSATINGSAEKVYTVLADYVNHHPHILPPAYFTKLEVEEGGTGAGTVFRAGFKMMGQQQPLHMRVTEPEPGRVLVETDLDSVLVTKFIVEPRGDNQSEVTFDTTMNRSPGIQGLIERLIVPGYLRRVYRVEQQQLDEYVRRL